MNARALFSPTASPPSARARLLWRCERGFAMPAAVIILFIITVLLAAAVKVASQTSTSTTRDTNVKAEIEAAEAGLQVGGYRLSQLEPKSTQCVNGEKAVETKCESGVEALGNNATFQYWTTLPLKTGETCAGRSVVVVAGKTLRCLTSEGLVNSVKPGVRLQELVSSSGGEALFGIKGMVGLSEFKATGTVKVPVPAVSNEKIIGEGSANFEQGYEICPPKGSFTPEAEPKSTERKRSGVMIHGINPTAQPEYEITRKEAECPIKAEVLSTHATEANNEDARIGVQDKLVGGIWNAVTHEMTLEGTSELTLSGSKYFFCNFKMPGGSPKLKIASGAKVEIFIDTSEDKEAKCVGTGKFEIAGGSEVINEGKNPANLLIQIGGKGTFELANGSKATLEAAIYDPGGEVIVKGGQKFKGGIVGNKVHLENGSTIFEWSEELSALTNGAGGSYARESWEQCTPGSGATEGC